MRLQRLKTRKVGGKTYAKWAVNLPDPPVKEMGWSEGDELGFRVLKDGILLFKATVKSEDSKEITYVESLPAAAQYQPQPMERFARVYANLPMTERVHVVLVIQGEPITWKVAYGHVLHKTPLGEKILKKLTELEII